MFLITVSLFALCGMMGLAVDLGWSFFVKKAAQSAADAAAMAAVREALRFGVPGGFACGGVSGVVCAASPVSCAAVSGDTATYGNLASGCSYASTNGFASGGHNGRQAVTIQANDNTSLPPTAPGVVDLRYWVSVSITETVPQMFSAVLGNAYGQVTARATAGAVQVVTPGSFYALNREGDCMGGGNCGVNIDLGGNGTLQAPRGLMMASSCSGNGSLTGCGDEAGIHHGGGRVVNTPSILIRQTGTADSTTAFPNWTNGGSGASFDDPMKGRVQPPIVASSPVPTCGVLNGMLQSPDMGPFNYYAYTVDRFGNAVPSGAPLTLNSTASFSPTGTCPGRLNDGGGTVPWQTGSFPSYMFYGGLRANNGASVTFGAGQYVVVGAPARGSNATAVFDSGGGNATMATASGASNMFVFTAPQASYPGLNTQMTAFTELQTAAARGALGQGYINLKAGNSSSFDLRGYVKGDGPAILDDYNGVLMWQDRKNSTVKYNANGTYGCAGPNYVTGCTKSSGELITDGVLTGSNRMIIDATANFGTGANGVLYQPRGTWLSKQGNGDLSGGLQIITGALEIGGGGDITLNTPGNPLLSFLAALIE